MRTPNVFRSFIVFVLCMFLLGHGADAQVLSWSSAKTVDVGASSVGLSLAIFQKQIFAAWKGYKNDQGIYWSSYAGPPWAEPLHPWASQQNIWGVGTSHGPSLATFNGRLFAAWKGIYDDQGIYWSSFDGSSWAPQQNIPGVGSSVGPSLAAFGGRLFAAWKGIYNDQGIYWSSFDGSSWAPQQNIPGVGSSVGPSLASFGGMLFAVWKGVYNDQAIYWSTFDGTSWAPQQSIPGGAGTSTGVSLTVTDALYAAWKGRDNDNGIYWATFNWGTGWSQYDAHGLRRVGGATTSGSPAIISFQNRIVAAWNSSDQVLWYMVGTSP